jgi:hypothetical protein
MERVTKDKYGNQITKIDREKYTWYLLPTNDHKIPRWTIYGSEGCRKCEKIINMILKRGDIYVFYDWEIIKKEKHVVKELFRMMGNENFPLPYVFYGTTLHVYY